MTVPTARSLGPPGGVRSSVEPNMAAQIRPGSSAAATAPVERATAAKASSSGTARPIHGSRLSRTGVNPPSAGISRWPARAAETTTETTMTTRFST
ncbi:hypothetical protein ACFQES_34975 [Nonomuraea salmonea]|uniref:hypothetical protein n=1 Tax=Nonomuraea salmonea TaxID=46181 RepID=UPI00361253B9